MDQQENGQGTQSTDGQSRKQGPNTVLNELTDECSDGNGEHRGDKPIDGRPYSCYVPNGFHGDGPKITPHEPKAKELDG